MKKIGIDLGTTNSCVYYLNDEGEAILVQGDRGQKFFPSAVWCAGPGKERIVGGKAKAKMGFEPSPVIAAKRKMGTDEKVLLGGVPVDAVEISTEILRYAKRLVEQATHDTVGAVVVTMPAYFDSAPKQDTMTAAIRAFFDGDKTRAEGLLELHLEPEAAAYAYTSKDAAESLKVLVYDLGGGTFDVTVMEKTPESGLCVIRFGGDPHLGGDNVDDRLALWILYLTRGGKPDAMNRILGGDRYPAETRYTIFQQLLSNDIAGLRGELRPEDKELLIPCPPRYDLELSASVPADLARIQTLKLLAESAKKELTVQADVAIVRQSAFTDHSGEMVDLDVSISRAEFDLLIGDMVAKTMKETLDVVERSGLKPADLDRVLMVGGSSRMLVVGEELRTVFACPVLLTSPDLIVAEGAALLCGRLGRGARVEGLSLEFPERTAEAAVSIAGRLAAPVPDGQVYLTPSDGGDEKNAAVDGDKFLLRGVPLRPGRENRFHLEVLDARENICAETELTIIHDPCCIGPGGGDGPAPKFTKPIRYLGKSGYRVLFEEGEPLPATKKDICYRASTHDSIRIPIYEGERWLRDLMIENIDSSVNVGAEITFQIHIGRDFKVSASATIVSTKQSADIEFQIEPVRMPSMEELTEDKEKVIEEVENALGAVKDRNKLADFRRSVRRLEGDFIRASRAAEPDRHHLFSVIGELRKVKVDIENSQNFMAPPLEEFEGAIRACRNLAPKLPPSSALKKEDVLKKIDSLERAGKDAWEKENQREWGPVVEEAKQVKIQIEKELDQTPPSPPPPPEVLVEGALEWLAEMSRTVREKNLDHAFEQEIEENRTRVRKVDLDDADLARQELFKIIRSHLRPLDARIKKAVGGPDPVRDKDNLPDWRR